MGNFWVVLAGEWYDPICAVKRCMWTYVPGDPDVGEPEMHTWKFSTNLIFSHDSPFWVIVFLFVKFNSRPSLYYRIVKIKCSLWKYYTNVYFFKIELFIYFTLILIAKLGDNWLGGNSGFGHWVRKVIYCRTSTCNQLIFLLSSIHCKWISLLCMCMFETDGNFTAWC